MVALLILLLSYTPLVRSVRVIANDDAEALPLLTLGGDQELTLSFDVLDHQAPRLTYTVQHMAWDWQTESDGLFESDYMQGINGRPIDDYDYSFNTNQLYTHYSLTLPNDDFTPLLSGNYRIYVRNDDTGETILHADFLVSEQTMKASASVSSDTDIDFNKAHQQMTLALSYGSVRVTDPERELRVVVRQNRRTDNQVLCPTPNIRKATGLEWTHRRELIFDAGSEYRKFELIDMHRPTLGIDRLRWEAPDYHAYLLEDRPARHYTYDQDHNGISILRNAEYDDEELTSEYIYVHFLLRTEEKLAQAPYVGGQWNEGMADTEATMTWNDDEGAYEAVAYLKQGFYSYQYRLPDGTALEGPFYQTENQYEVLVYHRPPGSRYDRLVEVMEMP